MKVLFLYVSTNMCRDGHLWYHDEGAASVAACLRRAGHRVAFRMVGESERFADIAAWVEAHREPNTLLVFLTSLMFSAYGHDRPGTFPLVAHLREAAGLQAAFVGVHATLNPEVYLEHVDFVGRGEMEEALVELCDALDAHRPASGIRNFWVNEGGTVHRNPLRPLVGDLTRLPFPARDLLPPERMANECDGILTVVGVRGCPLDCNFCSNPVLKRLYHGNGRYVRWKPVGYLLEEVRAACAVDPNIRALFFHDDIFGLSAAWTREFFARYPTEVGLPYGCNLVIGQVTPAFAAALRRSGCRQVQIGIESGSPYLRNQVLGKGITEDEITAAVRTCRRAGLYVKFYAMTGVPQETRRRFRDSVRGLGRFQPDMIQIQVWEAHEGSSLLRAARRTGRRAGEPGDRGRHRRARRLKFFFRYYHRFVAVYEALHVRRARHPVLARLAARLVDGIILFPWTPTLLLPRDGPGRRRFPARLLGNARLARWARRFLGRFWDDVRRRERRLASVYIWPPDLTRPQAVEALRVDGRETIASTP